MESQIITKERFLSFRPLKQDIVHVYRNQVYKYDDASKDIVLKLNEHRDDPEFKKILIPDTLLYERISEEELSYFGYKAKYYRRAKKVLQAVKSGKINIDTYFLELLQFIDLLNKNGILYWDFHDKNILVLDGHPFILDIDDICLTADADDETCQREYLTEFILNMYFEQFRSIIGYKNDTAVRNAFSREFTDYLAYTLYRSPEHILPYKILEELQDKDKVAYVKKYTKNNKSIDIPPYKEQ